MSALFVCQQMIRATPFFRLTAASPVIAIVESEIHQLSDCINYMKQFGRASCSHLIIKHTHELFFFKSKHSHHKVEKELFV